jgi:hypothetical protein
VPKTVRPPVTWIGANGTRRFSTMVSWRPGPETPYWSNASAETMYEPSRVPVATVPMFHVKLQLRPLAPTAVGAGDLTVPSSSQLSVVGLDDVVSVTPTDIVVGSVTVQGAPLASCGVIVRTAGPLALPGLLMMPVWLTSRVRLLRVQVVLTVTRL